MHKGKRRSPAEWQTIIQQQHDSGLSVIEFCQQQNLCSKTLYKHRRDLQSSKKMDLSNKAFIKIKNTSKSPTPTNTPCVLHYQDCRLHIHSTTDVNWVAQIIKALS